MRKTVFDPDNLQAKLEDICDIYHAGSNQWDKAIFELAISIPEEHRWEANECAHNIANDCSVELKTVNSRMFNISNLKGFVRKTRGMIRASQRLIEILDTFE